MPEDHHQIDVSGVQPAARPIVERIARVFIEHLGTSLVTLVAHGSAVKGGIIWGSSDVDAVAFVRPQRLTAHGELPFEQAVAVHRDLARIDPAPFRYLQAYVSPAQPARTTGRPGFIPETFQIVTGAPDVPIATGAALMAAAGTLSASWTPMRSGRGSATRCSTMARGGWIGKCDGRVRISGR